MILLKQVSKKYKLDLENSVEAVRGVDLCIESGEFLVITGRSGSGKTTLLNLAAGLAKPTQGQVYWDDVDLWKLPDHQQSVLRNQKMGFIFQFPSLLPSLTTLENVALPAIFATNGSRATANERAAQLLQTVGLEEKLFSYPRQLSAGQQQRVVVARALLQNPPVLLADEPTSNLDEQTEREIMDLFLDIHRKTGITIVMVTHTRQLISYGTRSIEMVAGKIASSAASGSIVS
jgi:ABC-type lipoprotein export system ATPase subunit